MRPAVPAGRRPGFFHLLAAALGAALACAGTPARADNPAEAVELQKVEVIGTTPLPGLGTPLRDVPANVQSIDAKALARQRQGNLAEFLANNPASVNANSVQGNPYQLDIGFRGFTASPLLGVPQGLSVFQDGVRINEPFGDVVNWDLLPQSAIAGMQIIPGSNPLFGLNTLGGALALYTKSGSRFPGTSVEMSGGSFGRRTLQVEHGGSSGPWDWYLTGHVANEHGWATHNSSRVRQFFGKLGYQSDEDDLDLSFTAADNALEGSQTLPASFLDDRRQAYTYPDLNGNQAGMLALKGSHVIDDTLVLGGNAYVRRYHNRNFSSNVNDNFGEVDPVSGAVDPVQAFNDLSTIGQTSYGAGLQLTSTAPLMQHANQFVVGASADAGRARYRLDAQPAMFSADRGTVAVGDFAPDTNALTGNRSLAVFATDTLTLDPRWSATGSLRLDRASVSIRDESGLQPRLNGDHAFSRANPALGLNFNPSRGLTAYGSYNEGMRAPTAVELTCADPDAPCKLPNAFIADPPLRKVVARTLEVGLRGKSGAGAADEEGTKLAWSAAAYRSNLSDDIQFVSSGNSINAGYFANVGATRRQGLELSGSVSSGPWKLSLRYSYIEATYQDDFVEHSPANSSSDGAGDIMVQRGKRLPGVPRHGLRARLEYERPQAWSFGVTLAANSSSPLRGDENQADSHGAVPGYAVLNVDAGYHLTRSAEIFLRVDNLSNRRYANFGVLGNNVFTGPGRSFDPAAAQAQPFYGLGAPRGAWAGLRVEWP